MLYRTVGPVPLPYPGKVGPRAVSRPTVLKVAVITAQYRFPAVKIIVIGLSLARSGDEYDEYDEYDENDEYDECDECDDVMNVECDACRNECRN